MAKILGTNVAAPIVPFSTQDTFPTHCSEYGKGGWREVADIQERDAITADRRSVGMAVYVIQEDTFYILKGGLSNEHWHVYTISAKQIPTVAYDQTVPSDAWTVQHNLGRFPSVTVVDSAGTTVMGDVQYLDENNISIGFSSPFTGKVYLT